LPTGYYGIINVAGANVLDIKKRWNDAFVKELFDSRVKTTKLLANCIKSASDRPKVFVGASAIGYYPPSETVEYTESYDRPLNDVFGRLCVEWEAAAQLPAEFLEVRRVTIRIGLVLGRTGGMIGNLFWPFFMGVGGRVASGRQWFPWIHIDDITGIFVFALQNDRVRGVLNGTAPKSVRNEEFTKALGAAFMRPTFFPAPEFVLACVYGKERAKMLTSGQKVIPKRTLELGYEFKFADIDSACREVARISLTAEETKRRANIGA